jgi:outer membrane protein OmpA-like peptidoglycan-associated protein
MNHIRPIALLIASSLTLSACQTLDPYTREEKTSNATKGATIGAVAGALLGYATGDDSKDRRKRALIGAGVGGLTGGGIGYYMDQQEMKLRQQLEGTGVSVTRAGDNIILNMPSVTFDVDRSEIKPRFMDVLDSVSLVVKEFNQTLIDIVGHTDSTGDAGYNMRLSQRRADSVGSYLIRTGVNRDRVATGGQGESYPVASNNTAAGRQQNRRVEITLSPLTQGT